MTENYSVSDYIADLRAVIAETEDEGQILSRVRPLAQKIVANSEAWFKPEYAEYDPERGSALNVLNAEAEHSLMVFTGCLRPNYTSKVHDHGTWAVVVGIEGKEKETMWRRNDDGAKPGYADLEQGTQAIMAAGKVSCMLSGDIHTVWNVSDDISLSLHTYGKHVNFTDRSQFDPEAKSAEPFLLTVE